MWYVIVGCIDVSGLAFGGSGGGRGGKGGGDERPRAFGGRGGCQLVILEAEMVLWRNFDLDDVIVKCQ
jgi:hypothetical protein